MGTNSHLNDGHTGVWLWSDDSHNEKHNGEIIMRPVKVVHPDQEYFYTKEWQKGEAQADKDIANGNVIGPFDNTSNAGDCCPVWVSMLLATKS